MKFLKRFAISAAVLALLVAAVLAYIAATFDAARIKQEAAQLVLAKTGRTLSIDGDLALSFWPSLGVKVDKVSLSEHNSKTSFVAFDSAHVSLRLLPLLSKQVVAERIELDGLKLTLTRDRDGRLNIDDLLASDGNKDDKGGKADASAGQKVESGPPQFDIAAVHVGNATIEWRDQRAGRTVVLSPLDFDAGHAVSGKDGLSIEDVKFATHGKLDADDLDIKIEISALKKHGESISVPKLALSAKLSGKGRNANGSITLDSIDGTLAALRIAGLALDIDAKSGDSSFKGSMKSPLVLDLDAGTVTLAAMTGALSLDAPTLPVHPLQLPISGQIKSEFRKPTVSGKLATKFDDSQVAAQFNIAGFSPLALGIELDVDKLNVDRYLPPAPTGSVKAGTDNHGSSKTDDAPLDFSALRKLNCSGNIRIGDLQVKNIKTRNLRVSFRAANGRIDVAPHSADLYGGHIAGSASLDAKGNVIGLNETLTGINIQPLLKDIADKDVVEGHGDVTLDIATRGTTVTAMKKALSGSARAVLRDGAIKGINIAQSLRAAKARIGSGDVAQQAVAADKTDFSELSASFKIVNGVAHNDDLVAKSPFLRLGGSGDIDIGNSQLNYLLKAAVVGTSAGQDGKELDSLKGITVPVRLTGPFDKLSFKLELADLINDAAKSRVKEKQQEIKQKLQDNLKNQLKGLFGK